MPFVPETLLPGAEMPGQAGEGPRGSSSLAAWSVKCLRLVRSELPAPLQRYQGREEELVGGCRHALAPLKGSWLSSPRKSLLPP